MRGWSVANKHALSRPHESNRRKIRLPLATPEAPMRRDDKGMKTTAPLWLQIPIARDRRRQDLSRTATMCTAMAPLPNSWWWVSKWRWTTRASKTPFHFLGLWSGYLIRWKFLSKRFSQPVVLPLDSVRLVQLNQIILVSCCQTLNNGSIKCKFISHSLSPHLKGAATSNLSYQPWWPCSVHLH